MSGNQNVQNKFSPFYWMKCPGDSPKGTRKDFINPEWIPWTNWLMPGTYFKLLLCDLVSGNFTMLLKVDPNIQATTHWHLHNTEAFILDGCFYYEDGDDKGHAGYYTCETAGSVHTPFTTPDGCLMFAISHGPIAGYNDDGELVVIADARLHYYMARENNAVEHTTVIDYAYGSTHLQD